MERYYSFPTYCKKTFGKKLFRIPLNAGFTCPNRDGKLDTRGCIFCDGSDAFSTIYKGEPLELSKLSYIHKPEDVSYIGYFQAFTNTYGPYEQLKDLYTCALKDPLLSGISIATRPDCLNEEILNLLEELKEMFPNKFIWIELGLQTIHEKSAKWMRRGYELSTFDWAVKELHLRKIPVIAHIIVGLPDEKERELIATITHLNQCHIEGIKIHLLHVLQGTDLAKEYQNQKISVLTKEQYIDYVSTCIGYLDPSIVIHRLTGDGSKDSLIAPLWSLEKRNVLNQLQQHLKEKNITQGCYIMK